MNDPAGAPEAHSTAIRRRAVTAVGIALLCLSQLALAAPLLNRLATSPSPYLAAHADDPVAWQEWNAATLALARERKVPLFVSIGYFSCHWCHVMQRESYRDPQIAALLNRDFIPVKVDREVNGAFDAEMIEFARRTRGRAGWPLNVVITPEGYPLYATLYSKPEQFLRLLTELRDTWKTDSAELGARAKAAALAVTSPSPVIQPLTAALAASLRGRLVEESLAMADFLRGGLNQSRKFPAAPQLMVLLEIQQRHPDPRLDAWLRLTLDRMGRGGLRDHVGGGFFRYTVDPDWHTPHFEKMLYDNAQLALLYLRAAKVFGQEEYRRIAFETLDFMLAEMRDPASGAFITSISAVDAEGREGGVYLWTGERLQGLLSPDELVLAGRIWGLDQAAESELGYLPQHIAEPTPAEQARLDTIHAKLREARRARHPPKDGKLLASLNGLALMALSEAATIEPRYLAAAAKARDFLLRRLWRDGRLYQGMGRDKRLGEADLEGYAYAAAGLARYGEVRGGSETRAARELLKAAWKKFHAPQGFRLEQAGLLARPHYQLAVSDGATPSPSALLIGLSLRADDESLRALAQTALAEGVTSAQQGAFLHASQIGVLNRMFEP